MAEPSTTGGQQKAYLVEKNRLLTERVTKLEAELEQKEERIETLEAACRELRDTLSQPALGADRHSTQYESDTQEGQSTPESVWTRAKRYIGNTSE